MLVIADDVRQRTDVRNGSKADLPPGDHLDRTIAGARVGGMGAVSYLHLSPGQPLPEMTAAPFRAVIVIDAPVASEWQSLVSEWLVRSGCLYMVAWGLDCSLWDDSVDHANLAAFDYGEVPVNRFVMTTWHAGEPLSEAFWFAAHCATHPDVELSRTLIVHISQAERRTQLLAAYQEAAQAVA